MNLIPDIIASIVVHALAIGAIVFFESCAVSPKPPKITYITAIQPPAPAAPVETSSQKSPPPEQAIPDPPPTETPKNIQPPENPQPDRMKIETETKTETKTETQTKTETKTETKTNTNKVEQKKLAEERKKKEEEEKQREEEKRRKKEEEEKKQADADREKRAKEREERLKRLVNSKEDGEGKGTLPSAPGPVDAILGKYIEQCKTKIVANWNPLPSLISNNPTLVVIMEVKIYSDGKLSTPSVYKSSGNRSFDASAIRALKKTKTLPVPPAKYKKSAAGGIFITIAAKDKQQ